MDEHRRPAVVLGIDPGLDGGLAWIGPEGSEAVVTPTFAAGRGGRRRFDAAAMSAPVAAPTVELVVIEAVGPMPKQGVVSTFGFGFGLGVWMGVLAALEVPHQAVTPQAWKKVILAGTAKDKAAAIAFAKRRSPGVPPLATPRSRVARDGIADALYLAEYARRLLLGTRAQSR